MKSRVVGGTFKIIKILKGNLCHEIDPVISMIYYEVIDR